jgi:VanZ family protein
MNNKPYVTAKKRFLYYALVLLWMALIFWFSSAGHEVSTSQSDGVIRSIQNVTGIELPEQIVRKAAHVTLYFVLGALLTVLVRTYDVRWRQAVLLAVAIACIYATTDELHQLVVGGRSGQVSDVVLDTIAAAAGALATRGVQRVKVLRKSS